MKISNITRWTGPVVLVVIAAFITSYLISYVRKNRHDTKEHMTQIMSRSPVRNMSVEKASNILPYLKAFLLYNTPYRSDLTSDNSKSENNDNKWEDLTENNNDFRWTSPPSSNKGGYHTAGRTLIGPSAKLFDYPETNELTVIIRSRSLESSSSNKSDGSSVDLSDIINNAELENKGEESILRVPAEAKSDFKALRDSLSSTNQNQDTIKKTLRYAEEVLSKIKKYPSVKKQKNPVAIRFRGNQGVALEIGIPDGNTPDGSVDLNVAGKHVPTQFKVMASNDNYYIAVYRKESNKGHVSFYVNRTQIISQNNVPLIHLTDNPVEINPSGSWNSALKEIAILNRALDPSEIALFRSENSKAPVLSALTRQYDKHNLVPGAKQPEGCRCSGRCDVEGSESYDPYKPHKKPIKKPSCKAVCVCKGKKPYDPYNPDRTPEPNEIDNNKVPLGPGGDWIDPLNCPPVTKDCDGNYVWNGQSYGKKRRKARDIYMINNPHCKRIPDILDDWWNSQQDLPKNCPFKVERGNPCRQESCENVNWSAHTPRGLNDKCRADINEYCRRNYDLDDFCTCWRPGMENVGMCQKYRSKFQDPREYGIGPGSFVIEEHPDYDKYIRKDKVPCWGCDLEQSSGKEVCEPNINGECNSSKN